MRFAKVSSVFLLLALAAWASQQSAQRGQPVTVVGEVVDSACFMIHPQEGSTGKAHEECGKACALRNVPLAVLNESDKQVYFPADGNKQLLPFRGQRVRVTGTAIEKSEPMELKIPVGEKNQMTVRVEGGYKVVTIKTIAKTQSPSQ
ncbi:MAG: hypothetical protein A3J28_00720 [Acidobacteria bacterium RIFCSPLOWO2_12_FULL_60_22]|nr:MAG: hypothetical protein A3J28_00720 [Acidobacteria bacterium RIFCSPLOWO2_12_FULL_60_22]